MTDPSSPRLLTATSGSSDTDIYTRELNVLNGSLNAHKVENLQKEQVTPAASRNTILTATMCGFGNFEKQASSPRWTSKIVAVRLYRIHVCLRNACEPFQRGEVKKSGPSAEIPQ